MKRIVILPLVIGILSIISSCTPQPENAQASNSLPPIYPDYCDVTIPQNIAPLNFLVRDSCEAVYVEAGSIIVNSRGNEVVFDEDEWHSLLAEGNDVEVTVSAMRNGRWTQYKPFRWHIVADKIDPYLTYRLIEPDYEIWNHVEIQQRCVETFDVEPIAHWEKQENRCMNCHTYGSQSSDLSMMYVRGQGGGAILNQKGHLRKLDLKTPDMVSGSVYFGFSPSGRYVTFSTNVIIPGFHTLPSKRLEVYDSKSDVYVADIEQRVMLRSPLTSDSRRLETFPTFSPDGRFVYYCVADSVALPSDIHQLQYSLVRIPFDEKTGTFGNHVDTLLSAATLSQQTKQGKISVCHPRISPDGRYLLYTVAHYGTFPIWHPEADLQMMDLQTGRVDTLAIVNSAKSDTYHSWSSNSRWFVFASKRDDGLYGKPYFCYVDREGHAHKPFCLPQRYPSFYDNTLKSFNAPELGCGAVPFDVDDVARAMLLEAEEFK